jgi:ribonuclease BN (tRNA processing enzyme)
VRITVLGGCGAWPAAGQACSGYLLEHDGFRVLVDPGYATLPRLLAITDATRIDAVLVSHGHPDHCADLNPLLRARILADERPDRLPVHALPGALDAVLALDRPGWLDAAYILHELTPGADVTVGPFRVEPWLLPHFVPNVGLRLTADRRTVAYTGDTGPSPDLPRFARDADALIAEATYPELVPSGDLPYLSSASQAGRCAREAGVGHLLLTHLWPGTDPDAAREAAARHHGGDLSVAGNGVVIDLD